MPIKIKYSTQLFISYFILLVVVVFAFTLGTASYVKQYIETTAIQQLSIHLNVFAKNVEVMNGKVDWGSMLTPLQDGYGVPVRLSVIAANGKVKYDSEVREADMDLHNTRPEVIAAQQFGTGHAIRYSHTTNSNTVYVVKVLTSNDMLRLAIPLTYLRDAWGHLNQKLIIVAFGIFWFALCLTIWMARKISLPLKEAVSVLKKMKRKEFEGLTLKGSKVKEIDNLNRLLMGVRKNLKGYIRKLSREKNKRAIILDNMINGLIVTDMEGEVELLNNAAHELFFYTSVCDHKIHLNKYPEIHEFAQAVLIDPQIEPIEIKHPNGQRVLIAGSIYKESENSEKCILVAQDITKVNRLERTRQDFVANVSHELKTPITLIRSILETVQMSKEKGLDVGPEFLEKGIRHSDRLNQIIDDLLQLSTLETTGKELETSEASLHQILDRVVGLCEPLANKKGMVLQIEGKDVPLKCNAALIEQGVRNLVENAIKYAPEKTMVTMGGTIKNNRVTLFVKDEGPGIDKKYIKRLFQRFYRIDDARSRELGGTGLGLAIVKHIAQAHQGRAWVDSVMGEGSCFNLELPTIVNN